MSSINEGAFLWSDAEPVIEKCKKLHIQNKLTAILQDMEDLYNSTVYLTKHYRSCPDFTQRIVDKNALFTKRCKEYEIEFSRVKALVA